MRWCLSLSPKKTTHNQRTRLLPFFVILYRIIKPFDDCVTRAQVGGWLAGRSRCWDNIVHILSSIPIHQSLFQEELWCWWWWRRVFHLSPRPFYQFHFTQSIVWHMSSSTHNVRTYSRNMWGLYKNIAALQGSNKQTKNTSPQPDLDLNNNPVSIICRCCCCPRMGRRMEAASVTCWSFSWPIPIDLNFAFTWKNTRTCFYYLHTQFATLSWPIYHNTTLSPFPPPPLPR